MTRSPRISKLAGYTISERYEDEQCDLAALASVLSGGHAVVIIDTHGAAESETETYLVTRQPYDWDTRMGLPQDERWEVGFSTDIDGNAKYFAVNNRWVAKYADIAQGVVFANACFSLAFPSMAGAMLDGGAAVYFGYTDSINITMSNSIVTELFDAYSVQGQTAAGAHTIVRNDILLRFTSFMTSWFLDSVNVELFEYRKSDPDEPAYLNPGETRAVTSGTWTGEYVDDSRAYSGTFSATIEVNPTTGNISGSILDEYWGETIVISSGVTAGLTVDIQSIDPGSSTGRSFIGSIGDDDVLRGEWAAQVDGVRTTYGTWSASK